VAAAVPVQPERVEQRQQRDYMGQLRLVESQAMARNAERRQEGRDARALSQLRELEAQTMARNAERRAERRALGFVTPASPAQNFVSARSLTPVDLTFANEVLRNAQAIEEASPMLPATIIPIRRSPQTAQSERAAVIAEAEAEAALARESAIEALNNEFANNEELPAPGGNPVANAVLSPLMLAKLRLRNGTFTSEEFAALSSKDRKAMSKVLAEHWGVVVPERFTANGYPVKITRNEPWWLAYGSGIFRG
jgi:hypothetical protein